jgi:hypothetical protein
MSKKIPVAVVLTVLVLTGNVWAMCGKCAPGKVEVEEKKVEKKKVGAVTAKIPKLEKDQVIITGTVICTSCDLKKAKGAKSQCSIYGCNYVIKTKDVRDYKGKPIKDEIGKIFHILENDNSSDLLQKKCKGREVIIVGKLYSEERIIEIEFVKLASVKKSYTCSMCGGDFDKPGKCPKCGMKLKEIK